MLLFVIYGCTTDLCTCTLHRALPPPPQALPGVNPHKLATKDATMQTYLVLKGRQKSCWEKARESVSWGKQILSVLANPTPRHCVYVCDTGKPLPLLRGYIRNVKLHQTISALHPHESQTERERGG